ncbi:MAG TPA: hypothetical protein VFS43_41150 [Polyangiaceae bacterium]|nr:hypothetical protein [Polyangiaceae bacterium]
MTDPPPPLFERIVERSGLSRIFAAGVVRRACAHAKIDPAQVTPHDLPLLMPHLRVALSVYLPPDQVQRRLGAIAALGNPDRGGSGEPGPKVSPVSEGRGV